jgi:transposase
VIAYFRSLEPCLVGMEACATAHHWARELTALGQSGNSLAGTVSPKSISVAARLNGAEHCPQKPGNPGNVG